MHYDNSPKGRRPTLPEHAATMRHTAMPQPEHAAVWSDMPLSWRMSSQLTCLPVTVTPPARPECVVGSRVLFCASARPKYEKRAVRRVVAQDVSKRQTHHRTHDRHGQSVRLSLRTSPAAPVMTYRLVQTRSRRAPRVPHSLRTRRHFAPRPSHAPPPVHQPPAHARPVSARTHDVDGRRGRGRYREVLDGADGTYPISINSSRRWSPPSLAWR